MLSIRQVADVVDGRTVIQTSEEPYQARGYGTQQIGTLRYMYRTRNMLAQRSFTCS